METKEEYINRISAKLRELSREIDELKVQASLAKAEAKEKYMKQVDEMNARRAEAEGKFRRLREGGEAAWQDLRGGVEEAVSSLKKSMESAMEKFKVHK